MGQDKPDPYGLVRVGGQESSTRWHFGQTFLPLWPNLWLGRFLIYKFVQRGKEHPAAHLECLAQLPYGRGWSLAFLCLFKPEGQNSIRGASQIWSLSKLGLTPLAAWGIFCCVAFLGCMRGFWTRVVVVIYILTPRICGSYCYSITKNPG